MDLRRLAGVVACAALLFAATLWLDTRQNGFPFFYHPDEPDKVDQLITGKWNFHHPLLMLGTAEIAKRVAGVPNEEQPLVVLGRWCSAAFAAGGVTAFALLGWRLRGWGGFWLTGLLLGTQHQVYELAHYFKEDTALFCAVGLVFLALHVHHTRPRWSTAAMLGVACGLAVSAKYLGAVMLIPAVVIMVLAQRGTRVSGVQWAGLLVGFFATVAVANFPVFTHFEVFTHSFGRETTLVAQGEKGYTGGQVALLEYLGIFANKTTPVIWLLMAIEWLRTWKRRDAFEWTLAIFPVAFMLLISCSTKTNDRYFLPAMAGFYLLGALGARDLPEMLRSWWPGFTKTGVACCAATAIALVVNGFYLTPVVRSFAYDDRTEMLQWIRENVPASATIAGENRADLPIAHRPARLAVQPLLSQQVIETKYAADLAATPSMLHAQGIDYIVISESDYGVFIRKAAATHLTPEMQAKRAFYETLFRDYKPLWERQRGTGVYLHPGLSVYRVSGK